MCNCLYHQIVLQKGHGNLEYVEAKPKAAGQSLEKVRQIRDLIEAKVTQLLSEIL